MAGRHRQQPEVSNDGEGAAEQETDPEYYATQDDRGASDMSRLVAPAACHVSPRPQRSGRHEANVKFTSLNTNDVKTDAMCTRPSAPLHTPAAHLPDGPSVRFETSKWHDRICTGPSPLTAFLTFISRQIYIFEVIKPHTVGSLTIPRASIKWV